MYCIIFLASLYLTFGPSGPRCANKFVAFANILLFSVCTTHFGITFNEFYTKLVSGSSPEISLKISSCSSHRQLVVLRDMETRLQWGWAQTLSSLLQTGSAR